MKIYMEIFLFLEIIFFSFKIYLFVLIIKVKRNKREEFIYFIFSLFSFPFFFPIVFQFQTGIRKCALKENASFIILFAFEF